MIRPLLFGLAALLADGAHAAAKVQDTMAQRVQATADPITR